MNRKVLLCSVGLTPQIVTETLYALMLKEWWPDKLIIITTGAGAAACNKMLLDAQTGGLARFAREYSKLAAMEFTKKVQLITVQTDTGDLDDGRWTAKFSDKAKEIISEICSDPKNSLHVSISGGRKTAAAILALLMAIYGRAHDRISHVQTVPDMRSNPSFWFPTNAPEILPLGDGNHVASANIFINLIDVPFPRLDSSISEKNSSFKDAMEAISSQANKPRLIIFGNEITWNGALLDMPPAIKAWTLWLIKKFKSGEGLVRVGSKKEDYLKFYKSVAGHSSLSKAEKSLPEFLEPEWMEEKASRIIKLAKQHKILPNGDNVILKSGDRSMVSYVLNFRDCDVSIIAKSKDKFQ